MATYQREVRGLVVAQQGHGYAVTHAASGLAATPVLRQRRFAEQARDELLATGVDFTQAAGAISQGRAQWAEVYHRWQQRARAVAYDSATGEYYSPHVSYGTFVPSAAWAQAYRDALAGGDSARISDIINRRSV